MFVYTPVQIQVSTTVMDLVVVFALFVLLCRNTAVQTKRKQRPSPSQSITVHHDLCCYRFSVNKDLYRCPRGANTGVRWRRRRTQHTDNGGWVQHSGTAACQERQACWTINSRLCSAAMLLLAPWRWLQKQNSELSVPTGLCVRWRCPCSGSFLSKFAVKWILKIPFTLHMLLHYLVKH